MNHEATAETRANLLPRLFLKLRVPWSPPEGFLTVPLHAAGVRKDGAALNTWLLPPIARVLAGIRLWRGEELFLELLLSLPFSQATTLLVWEIFFFYLSYYYYFFFCFFTKKKKSLLLFRSRFPESCFDSLCYVIIYFFISNRVARISRSWEAVFLVRKLRIMVFSVIPNGFSNFLFLFLYIWYRLFSWC